ncbi:serine hydroxymethyltransferase [Candidatus Jorgensenbacteria bacterium RIFCSPLOWO2_01_FULL_45_25b]|uniref:Serine hydroxymethyltransferase n=1 Tax=Candidatus Jorgensenbacteria bacterium RIFCSPLOWO2_01_FULL_45_25b TaxID=1798471 RepID=A0A1F6BWF9_9BACT|nr:MAG: serine hydroxymethyltransferase [Candidatus Jorgensenbacteria bacterium RIFCSPLOWO2_01_FULL_45_25b]
MKDDLLHSLIQRETIRQSETMDLIASENYTSPEVLQAVGSVFSNKYAEGYPRKRYYQGNAVADELEELAISRGLTLFGLSSEEWSLNVQPYSGSPANLAVYLALLAPGEKVMGMQLSMGGHLTHGHKVSATGIIWNQVPYGVSKDTEMLDYNELMETAKREMPKMIIAGYTAYPRVIDWKKFREIADAVGAYLFVDMSHLAGLVAGDSYPSPFQYADVVTTTTHKTLRGPRSAIIFTRKQGLKIKDQGKKLFTIAEAIDKAVFPGLQGGPHLNQIAGIAQTFFEASTPEFKIYAAQIVKNARALAEALSELGWRIVSGGTDSHLLLVDTMSKNIGGKDAAIELEKANIVTNMNTIPFDPQPPMNPSGLRLGTPSCTTRGMKEKEIGLVAEYINAVLLKTRTPEEVQKDVLALCKKFPLLY